jgi:hypothetical protein
VLNLRTRKIQARKFFLNSGNKQGLSLVFLEFLGRRTNQGIDSRQNKTLSWVLTTREKAFYL